MDLGVKENPEIWFMGKITGTIKDYLLTIVVVNGKAKYMWCSTSSYVFSELPKSLEDKADLDKLMSVNNLFTGEFDSVLF